MGMLDMKVPAVRKRFRSATGNTLGRMNQSYVYANGQQVASLDGAGKLDVVSRMTAFSNSSSGKSQTVVQAGEDLRNIAQRVYGNANLWYVLAAANALEGDGDLVAGATLTVPEVKTSSNDANTFKPYNPGEITGPTSPGLPYIEPPDKGCGTLGIIIMVAIAVVVTVMTAGAAAPGAATTLSGLWTAGTAVLSGAAGAGAIGAAALGGFVGSVASQAVGSAMGVTSFSWRNAFVSAAGAAVTAGIGSVIAKGAGQVANFLRNQQWAKAAVSATAVSLGNHAASRLVGNDASFSWRSVAASAVSAAVTSKLGELMRLDQPASGVGGSGHFGKDFASNMMGGVVSLHTRRAFGFDDAINYDNIAADAFGTALGNAVGQGIQMLSAQVNDRKSLDAEELDVYKDAKRSGLTHEQSMVKAIVRDSMFREAFLSLMDQVDRSIGSGLDVNRNSSGEPNLATTIFDGKQELTKVGMRVKLASTAVMDAIGDKLNWDTAESFFVDINRLTESRRFRNEIDANIYFAAIGLAVQDKLGVEVNANLIRLNSDVYRVVDFNHGPKGTSGEVDTTPFDSNYYYGWRLSGVMHTHPGNQTFSGAWQDRFNFVTNASGDITIAWSKKVDAYVVRPDYAIQKFDYSAFMNALRPTGKEKVYAHEYFRNL